MRKSGKQLFTVFAVLVMVLSMFTATSCMSDVDGEATALPKATVIDGRVKAEETVVLEVVLADAPPLETLAISEVTYDKESFEFIGAEWKVTDATLSKWDADKGKGAVAYEAPVNLNGTIISLTFKVKEDVMDGSYPVSCTISSHESTIENASGNLEVYSIIPSDVDENEK